MRSTSRARFSPAIVSAALILSLVGVVTGGTYRPALAAGEATLHIVVQSAPPVALYQGGIPGLAATNPESLGSAKLNSDSAATTAYRAYLTQARAELLDRIAGAVGHTIQVENNYAWAINGFSALLTRQEGALVANLPGVSFVRANENLHTLTDAGPAWMNADKLWDGSAISGVGSKGERIVAGIIDTGVNYSHPSFAQVGGDGYVHQNPRGRFYGECAATPPPAPGALCNNKLIGMYNFTHVGLNDDVGHGSHTASTVAGNVIEAATIEAPTTSIGPARISGVAPHANIISYKACQAPNLVVPGANVNLGTCPLNALIAAIDAATADVVDVVNFSIGGGSTDPWQDPLGLSFFGAHAAGVFVAASAGNSGPNPQTIGRPSNSPWLLSVGASTHNRRPTGVVTATKSNGTQLVITGLSLTTGLTSTALVDGKALGNEGCDPFNAAQQAQVAGKVVLCTGSLGRVVRGTNVRDAGGTGMILMSSPGYKNSAVSDTHVIPTVMIGNWDGEALRTWLAGATNPQATLRGVELQTSSDLADRMAGFSSRGPDLTSPDVIKPDVTAPGVSIWAAWMDNGQPGADYQMIQGTSMSSPHAAGAGALIRALHPDWTPDQIKSALMSTGYTTPDGGKETVPVTKEDHSTPADPFDRGGGRIDLARAARAGFTVSDSVAAYHAANPLLGGEPNSLNIASLASSDCDPTCTWTRTLTSTSTRAISYRVEATSGPGFTISVSPSTFTLQPIQGPTIAPGLGDPSLPGTQVVTVTVTNTGLASNKYQFGELRFVATDAPAVPTQHFPVAVKKSGGNPPPPDCEIPETIVSTAAPSSTVPPYNDVTEVGAAGLYPTLAGEANPNIAFRMHVTQLGVNGALPPNQFWRVSFTPPAAPAGTTYFVQLWTDAQSTPAFGYGTITSGFSVLGPPDSGSYDLTTNDIKWVIAASKITNPQVGQVLGVVNGDTGPSQPGALTLGIKTTSENSYTLSSCSGVDPTPSPTATPTPTPGGGEPTVLHFQGNIDEGCVGDGNADFYTCGGPFLRADSQLDPESPPARWETTSAQDDDTDRSLFDPNWIWELTEPTTIGGPMTVEWWGNCNVCAGDLIDASEWNIRVYADGVKQFEKLRIQVPISTPGVPERLTTTVNLPNISAVESIVLHVDPYWIDQQDPNVILYDSELGCGPDGLSACDSLVRMPVGGVTATPTPTATTSPTPTPTPLGCTPDHVYFLGVVNDGNEPGEPREDFRADMGNIEFYLDSLRDTYCIPDTQAQILAFTDGWKDGNGNPLSPYPEASEANVKAQIARLGAAASQHADSLFFFFLTSHGIVYTAAGWTGGDSECPLERVAGSLSGLKAGDGESGDFFDCELGTALNTSFAPTTRMFVLVDCSVCGGFSDSVTAVSGTVVDGSAPVSAGVVGPNRTVTTGCAMTTECFGSDPAANGGISYYHLRQTMSVADCDGWTAPGFPTVQGFDVPVNDRALRVLDARCTASEWFFAAVNHAYVTQDVLAIQQQFRIKYGMASIDDDILILDSNVEPPPAPDLQVTAMAGANQPPKEGDRVVVRATVTNAGDGAAGASTTELRLEDGTLIGTASTPGVAAGGSVEVQVAWDTHGVKGDQVITATADAGAAVAESREGNNLGRLTVSVKGNKVQNGSFEQPAEGGGAPESWQGSSTGAGETGYAEGGASDGSHAVTITGTGTSVALLGVPTWTSAPIAVAPGEVLTLVADVNCVGMSSAPTIGVVYLGPAGELLSTVTLLTGPLATSGFAALEKTFTVPTGVASVRLVLTGFSPTDVRTAGTVTFDDIGLYAN